MKLYNSLGPNPRCVRMFMAEKGSTLPTIELAILGAENRKLPYTDKNPGGQMPALDLDNGRVLGETVAIREYLEEKHPAPPLIGTTPEERILWIHTDKDKLVPLFEAQSMYAKARQPKKLVVLENMVHDDVHRGQGFELVVQHANAWFKEHLPARG